MARAEDLSLYHYDSCPYCLRVRRALSELDVEVELRNIHQDSAHMRALIEARGARTVPVLRIRHEDGDEWLPESADIVAYLRKRFAR
ncbi:MAG: glutathione S-transferase N-terminal domain-containing protein [Deltaproteobacteria bacterium]|nr:glutathione S-transferase N-terminal domain-containing protein [Deltaproteobacteria bacterium]